MDYFRRLEPTPSALRNGRLTLVIVAGALVLLVGLMFVTATWDPGSVAIAIATSVTVAGHGIAYLGKPTLDRYRVGLAVMTIGIVSAFALMLVDPFRQG